MAESRQETVSLSELVKRTAQESYTALKELVKQAPEQSDTEKKLELLRYINKTRQRLLRLHVLTQWCTQIPLIQLCQQLEGNLSNHELCFTQAADSLFFAHNGLQQSSVPIYDVPSALDVLLTGKFSRLPKCIEDIGMQTVLSGEERELALTKLDTLLRSRLLEVSLPKEISSVTISDGRVVLHVEGEFKIQLTLGYRGHLSLWRILHLELLVGERSGLLKLAERQRFSMGDDLERRMAAAENPFAILYSVLHEFCIALVMDTVIRQVKTLREGTWKDAIHFELISDINSEQGTNIGHPQALLNGEDDINSGQGTNIGHPQVLSNGEDDTSGMKTPGIKIMYWLDPNKGTAGDDDLGDDDLGCIPFLKIEPGQDQRITCSCNNDNTVVINPMTGNEAEFVLNESCIDVECLLLRAISCNLHTRLLEVWRVLKKNDQLCQAEVDIILKHPGNDSDTALNKIPDFRQNSTETDVGELGEELVRVRGCGLPDMVLGINLRNGRFHLPSRNLNFSSDLKECEDALNQRSLAPTEVFISLRNKNILNIFASVGSFMGLKVYKKDLATVEIPKSITRGSDLLLMGIPNCGNTYFLLIQLDVGFKPIFTMLESHQDSTGHHRIFRFRKIDVGKIEMVEEGLTLSLKRKRSLCSAKETRGSDIISEPGSNSDSFRDAVIQQQETLPQHIPKQNNHIFSDETSPSSLLGAGQGIVAMPKYEKSSKKRCLADFINKLPSLQQIAAHGESQKKRKTPSSLLGAGQGIVAMPKYEKSSKKRCLADVINKMSPLQQIEAHGESQKKRKTVCESGNPQPISAQLNSQGNLGRFVDRSNGNILMEANRRKAPSTIYASILLDVVSRCFLCIKQSHLTSQMEALGIPYIEDTGIQKPSADYWFRLPSSREDVWKKIGLWLGKPGTIHWDVKVYDEHFTDLWELHKGQTGTPWGSGVCIANTLDVDSHIRYGPKGVVLRYRTVEEDSVQKMVADLQRLSKARSFAMGMRRFLGVKPDERRDMMRGLTGRTLRIEAVGLMSLSFIFSESMGGSVTRFIVEWESGKEDCTVRVSPDHIWPHTKFLEDFINEGEVELLLDCIRLSAGPLQALGGAIRPARTGGIALVPSGFPTAAKTNGLVSQAAGGISSGAPNSGASGNLNTQNGSIVSSASIEPITVPRSLLPTDVSVVLRSPYWIRIIYREKFAVDMRCFAGDRVWLQPATPPKGGPAVGGSLPCPGFQSVIMNLNRTFIELENDSGYGGGWVPLASLKNVLSSVLKYLGVQWLFYQLIDILLSISKNEVLFDTLDHEFPSLSFRVRDYEFEVSFHCLPERHYFSLQVFYENPSTQQGQGQQQNRTNSQDELSSCEADEISDFFSRRIFLEPYDASRVASFVTLLLLPIPVLREFLKLIAWKKGIAQGQRADTAPSQRLRVELCLESHRESNADVSMSPGNAGLGLSGKAASAVAKSNIHYDRRGRAVDFGLIVVLDPASVPHVNADSVAACLPRCVSVRLKYAFGENPHVSLLSMEYSHRGCDGWLSTVDWECCKQRVAKAVEIAGRGSGASGSSLDASQGRLRVVAETLQHSLQSSLLQLQKGATGNTPSVGGFTA